VIADAFLKFEISLFVSEFKTIFQANKEVPSVYTAQWIRTRFYVMHVVSLKHLMVEPLYVVF
jgi:hypothetical protein